MSKYLLLFFAIFIIHVAGIAQFTNNFINYTPANTPVFTGGNFKSIWVGKDKTIWAGTQYQGLYRFDTTTKAWSKSSQLTNVFINDIKADKNGGIWIAQAGTTGVVGGGSNTAGGINYFQGSNDATMVFYNQAIISGGFVSRNSRAVYVDTTKPRAADTLPRIWAAFATFTSSSATATGGISVGLNANPAYFRRIFGGLQVFPNTNLTSSGTPSCYTVGGDKDEVWVGVEQNYQAGPTSQILRYDAANGQFLGGYDALGAFDKTRGFYNNQPRTYIDTAGPKGILPPAFRSTAIHFDAESRQWVGFRSGGLVVKQRGIWKAVNMPAVFPPGTVINFNAITSDEFGYIYIGTSNGLVVFDGGGAVDNAANYKRLTIAEGLASNNITGVCYDKFRGVVLLTSDAGVTFYSVKYKIDISMQWDYSFPDRTNQPVGVAADGVARIYLKVKKASDTLPEVKSVNILVANWVANEANVRGKIMKASTIDKYSEEANDVTSTEVTIASADLKPGQPGDYWFWYVAPDDFSNDSLSSFATLTDRYDSVRVIMTYLNEKKDTLIYKIRVVRPPLILQHGYNGTAANWKVFKYNNGFNFSTSPHFKYVHTPTMDPAGSAKKAANQLLGADNHAFGDDRLNTLQGNIEELRKMRFASNQVDFVCHSMGGVYIRAAMGWFPNKFYAGENYKYKTYKKGFTNKIITINTPHNGSPVGDLAFMLMADGTMPNNLHQLLFAIYNYNLFYQQGAIKNSIKPIDENAIVFSRMRTTDAVTDLQVTDANGGVNMPVTKVKNHLIAGDVDLDYMTGNFELSDQSLSNFYSVLIEMQYMQLCKPLSGNPLLAQLYKEKVLSKPRNIRIYTWFNAYINSKGYPRFIEDGDLIVPLGSELARQDTLLPNVRVFKNMPGTINAWHSDIVGRPDVGMHVFNLLNTKKSSPLFSENIPANTDPDLSDPITLNKSNGATFKVQSTFYDTSKIRIDEPLTGISKTPGSSINIKFRVKDTVGLAYTSIRFQFSDSLNIIQTNNQQTATFLLDLNFIGKQTITATAVYNKVGGGLDYYVDTISIGVNHTGTLQDFRVNEQPVYLFNNEPYYPQLQVKYNNQWLPLPNDAPGISAGVESPSIVQYNNINKSFKGINDGATLASFSYSGFVDTVSMISIMPSGSNCINQTIASGNYKNSAIWSEGVLPGVCDSVIINAGHIVFADTTITNRSLRIASGATLHIIAPADTLFFGQQDEGNAMLDNYGTLNISTGNLQVRGRVKFNAGSTFNMTGGQLKIDGNTGIKETSLPNNFSLFEATPSMASFNFSGGTLQIFDPPFGAASQALNCPYDFGDNSTLILGISSSSTASSNPDGFGGLSFPNKIGKLVIDAGTKNGNRQLLIKKPLSVKGVVEVKAGSGVTIQSPLIINQ